MKVDIQITNQTVNVGDVVLYRLKGIEYTCLVAKDIATKFKYRVVDLKSGEVLNGYTDINVLRETCTLLAKGDNTLLTTLSREDT